MGVGGELGDARNVTGRASRGCHFCRWKEQSEHSRVAAWTSAGGNRGRGRGWDTSNQVRPEGPLESQLCSGKRFLSGVPMGSQQVPWEDGRWAGWGFWAAPQRWCKPVIGARAEGGKEDS